MVKLTLAVAILGMTLAAHAQDAPPFSPMTDEAPLRKLMLEYSDLKDPFSAQFRRAEVQEIATGNGKTATVWCGQINAKNSNGGFTGWADFVVLKDGEKPIIAIEDGAAAAASKIMIDGLCEKAAIRTNP